MDNNFERMLHFTRLGVFAAECIEAIEVAANFSDAVARLRRADNVRLDDGWHDIAFYKLHFHMITAAYKMHGINEHSLQRWVRENIGTLIPGAVQIPLPKKASRGGGLCDVLVNIKGDICPVEVKLVPFGKAAVSQLRGYMDFYGSSRGFAVAPRLSVALPADITFVPVPSAWPADQASPDSE